MRSACICTTNDCVIVAVFCYQLERFYVEARYLLATLKMYYSTFRLCPLTVLTQLYGCLQDKLNLTTSVKSSGNLADFSL